VRLGLCGRAAGVSRPGSADAGPAPVAVDARTPALAHKFHDAEKIAVDPCLVVDYGYWSPPDRPRSTDRPRLWGGGAPWGSNAMGSGRGRMNAAKAFGKAT